MDKITVHLERDSVGTRCPCPLCGGPVEKEEGAYPAIGAMQINSASFSELICDECFTAGPTGVRERILEHAEALESRARQARLLSGATFAMPSVKALEEARRAAYEKQFPPHERRDPADADCLPFAAHEACVFTHPHEGPHWTASDMHILEMQETYGTRSPVCNWCGEPVWMSLQGFFSGGSWTTNPDNEGPNFGCKELDVQAEQCAKSLSGRHEVQTE